MQTVTSCSPGSCLACCSWGLDVGCLPLDIKLPFLTKTTLTHTGVERLLAHGERLRLTSKIAEKTEVRLFVYGRALDRGGQRPVQDPNEKVYISPNTHVIFDHPGVQWVTLHVNGAYRDALLRAGTITEGYFYAGYKLIHNA